MIVEVVRTPVGKRDGPLQDYHPLELGALVLPELLARAYASLTLRSVVAGAGANAWLGHGCLRPALRGGARNPPRAGCKQRASCWCHAPEGGRIIQLGVLVMAAGARTSCAI